MGQYHLQDQPKTKTVEHNKDLCFTIVYEHTNDPYVVNFWCYDIEGWLDDGKPLYHKKDSPSYPDPVETIEEAEMFLHGDVKWDGCSNWYFDEQNIGMLHGCSRQDVTRFGDVLGRCWDIAKGVMEKQGTKE